MWETATCDIRNKTYDQLPEELKDRFDEYQIEVVIHQDCEMSEISKLVRRFNNHVAMNSAQKAFTYADTFAREIRDITENRFFLDIYTCSRNDKKNGTVERIIADMVILCNYPEQYKGKTLQNFKWLNENGNISVFEDLNDLLTRLAASVETTKEIRALFNSKHAHIFAAMFKAFTGLEKKDTDFNRFLDWFVSGGDRTEIDGKTWEIWDANKATRDVSTVLGKIAYLAALMKEYFRKIKKAA